MKLEKVAVILFNLGGPDAIKNVQPFLFNLFNDPDIIDLPKSFRWLLAKYISHRRGPKARRIYDQIGGKSPLLELTREQATALDLILNKPRDGASPSRAFKSFVSMRYWHPMTEEVVRQVTAYDPHRIILLPLYPQYSSTTTGSSIKAWQQACRSMGVTKPTQIMCCYPANKGWIEAQVDLICKMIGDNRPVEQPYRILFSAHGLPVKTIARGDPYQWQVEQTCDAIMKLISGTYHSTPDWSICYQSRVGRLEWIGPSLDQELHRAAEDHVDVIVVPVSFVSEHSETLVELDIQYRHMAQDLKIARYDRVEAVATHPAFLAGLALLVQQMAKHDTVLGPEGQIDHDSHCQCLEKHSQCAKIGGGIGV